MSITWSEVKKWKSATLTSGAASVSKASSALKGLDDEMKTSCAPSGWTGQAAKSAASTLKTQSTALVGQVATMSAVHKGLTVAAAEVKRIEDRILAVETTAEVYVLTIDSAGNVSDALEPPAQFVDQADADAYRAGRQECIDQVVAEMNAIIAAAVATDTALNDVLVGAKEGKYAKLGTNLQEAALKGEQAVPATVQIPPPPKGSSAAEYAAWYKGLTKAQQAEVAKHPEWLKQMSDDHVVDPAASNGQQPNAPMVEDPVHAATGNFIEVEHDLGFTGILAGLSFARTYNSRVVGSAGGGFGARWASWADVALRARSGGVGLTLPDGRQVLIPRTEQGFGVPDSLPVFVSAGAQDQFVLSFNDGTRWEFDLFGQPSSIQHGPGTRVVFGYEQTGGVRRLTSMTHQDTGVRVGLVWEGSRVVALECSDGRRVEYAYDDHARLTRAVGGSSGSREYRYNDAGLVFEVVDGDGVVEVSNTYDTSGRVLSQVTPTGAVVDLVYLPGRATAVRSRDGSSLNTWFSDEHGRCVGIVDGAGGEHRIEYDRFGNPMRTVSRSGAVTDQWFDDRSRLSRRVAPDGTQTTFEYDELDRPVRIVTTPKAPEDGEVLARTITLEYPGEHRTPCRVVDAGGGVTQVQVDDRGLVQRVTDPDGVTVTVTWDELGRLVSAADAAGATTRFEHNTAGLPSAVVSPGGATTRFTYDAAGRVISRTDPDGATWGWEYTLAGRPVAVVDPMGARTETRYGASGLADATAFADRTSQSYRWDRFENLTGIVDAGGAAWGWEFDALQRVVASVDPAGARWTTEYDIDGNAVGELDPTGRGVRSQVDVLGRPVQVDDGKSQTRFTYDHTGQVTSMVTADGGVVTYEYDVCGRVSAVTDAGGGVTRYERTPAGRISKVVSPAGRVESYSYDAAGRLASVTDAAGSVSRLSYIPDGMVSARVYADGSRDTFDYDACGRVVAVHSAAEGSRYFTYDLLGRVTGINDAGFGNRRFVYDQVGNLVEAVDGNGVITRYEYDSAGRVVAQIDPLGGRTTWTYDAAGRAASMTDPLGRTMVTSYDAAGRKVRHTLADGTALTWEYDAAGEVAGMTATGSDGVTESYRVVQDPVTRSVSWTCDANGDVTVQVDANGNLIFRTRTMPDGGVVRLGWGYDADGARTSFTHDDGSTTEYTLDPAGLVVGLTHPQVGAATLVRDAVGRVTEMTAPGVKASWQYGPAGVTHHTVTRNGETATTRVARDAAGRVTRLVESSSTGHLSTTSYEYDGAGQLVAWTDGAGRTRVAYDAAGRITRETRTAGDVLVGTRTYAYDAAGQLLTLTEPNDRGVVRRREFEYDAAGNRVRESLLEGGVKTYSYDARGFLRATTTQAPGHEPEARELVVDALGELARVDDQVVVFDSADPFAPLARVGTQRIIGSGPTTATIGGSGSEWVTPDWRGLPTTVTDPYGASLAPRDKLDDPVGPSRALPGVPTAPVPGIPAQRRGQDDLFGRGVGLADGGELGIDGLTWLRFRTYDPTTRAFTGPDPEPPVTGTGWAGNPYSYAGNNPTTLCDPWGLSPANDQQVQGQSQDGNPFWDKVKNAGSSAWDWTKRNVSNVGHTALDTAGLIPVVGEAADGVNAVWYLAQGDKTNAALSAAAMVPVAGDAVTAAKWGRKAAKAGEEVLEHTDDAVRAAKGVDPAARRPKLRKTTKQSIEESAIRTPQGDIIDPNTGVILPKDGPYHYGHKRGYEWRKTRDKARREGWSRREVIEHENNPNIYQIEDPKSNMSHRYEDPR